ncbi:hypothetical protein NPIL_417741 [Nephila pilipes]|uniref:Uncharacterized protein n=1 Tax=Nephila pilipes TaxID=299642 RepID=A0A8X6TEJ5_NEPPI|nr:hypothetical protein NPIL_417741 [Nephila pilipes]
MKNICLRKQTFPLHLFSVISGVRSFVSRLLHGRNFARRVPQLTPPPLHKEAHASDDHQPSQSETGNSYWKIMDRINPAKEFISSKGIVVFGFFLQRVFHIRQVVAFLLLEFESNSATKKQNP